MSEPGSSGNKPAPAMRRQAPPAELSADAMRWLQEIPQRLRPKQTAQRYPHVVNRLAAAWSSPPACRAYFDDLLLDQRGGRQGFPWDIANELSSLRDHYDTFVNPTYRTLWDEIIANARA